MLKILKLSLLLVSGNCLVANTRYARPVSTKAYEKIMDTKNTSFTTSNQESDSPSSIKILTLDLETRKLENNNLEVISSCIYDGTEYYTFYSTDYLNPEALLEATMETLIKFKGYKVYVHNLSGFDAIFFFKSILDFKSKGYEVKIIKREDKFIKISIVKTKIKSWEKNQSEVKNLNDKNIDHIECGIVFFSKEVTVFDLTFYDSLLLLPSSLQKLSKSFNVEGKLDFNVLDNNTADLLDNEFRDKLLDYIG